MNAITIKAVCERTGFDPRLMRAVARQAGGWSEFVEMAPDIARNGINNGFHGFIYYSETVAFFKKNRALILELAERQAEEFGTDPAEMICGFNCLRTEDREDRAETRREVYRTIGGRMRQDDYLVANALCWYAGEEAARAVDDYLESER